MGSKRRYDSINPEISRNASFLNLMQHYVLDASVILKFLISLDEPHLPEACAIRNDFLSRHIVVAVPPIWKYEIGNILLTKVPDYEKRKIYWESFLDHPFLTSTFEDSDYHAIFDVAGKIHSTFYDASYLYLAQKFHCPLITADEKFLRKVGPSAPVMHLKNYGRKS